jgi:peptidyl-prolyl cis-trans isomerase SurA
MQHRQLQRWLVITASSIAAILLSLCLPSVAQSQDARKTKLVLDSVIAVVNHQVILASDLDLELRMMRLLPADDKSGANAVEALDRLTTRALIEQQIVLEDPRGLEVDSAQVASNLNELRKSLPGCKRYDCMTPSGWSAYLATLGLTPAEVQSYWVRRMAVLAFIDRRFRSGIRIAPEEVAKYYKQTLLPQYPSPADAPALDKVSARIQELLLQQQVNTLLEDWLKNLQAQGEVEILDPMLAAGVAANSEKKGEAQ